jgi:hypothetical protein
MSEEFSPGEKVRRSGIYKVTHHPKHAVPHDVTCIFGKIFPTCELCGDGPRFTLVRFAQDVEHDSNFKG